MFATLPKITVSLILAMLILLYYEDQMQENNFGFSPSLTRLSLYLLEFLSL